MINIHLHKDYFVSSRLMQTSTNEKKNEERKSSLNGLFSQIKGRFAKKVIPNLENPDKQYAALF